MNDEHLIERAKIIYQKGRNREAFLEGKVDKYKMKINPRLIIKCIGIIRIGII
ncbi:hypothetical protein [Coxiella-like endosymbiont of Rhipicephalus sanguineus]|uniref:hypothetical protein n=1 Tax=Coxiella-like endosymbiont of Rhipicephalus sanguineus TaxID=1955402 RepID=UPI0035577139